MKPALSEDAVASMTPEVERALVDNHRRFLAFLEKRVGSREVAEELLQTAFARTVETAPERVSAESAVAWIYRLLRNTVIDHWRKHEAEKRAIERALQELPQTVDAPEVKDEICGCMRSLLPALKPEYAEVVREVDLEERSITEVAGQLGVTANNATVRLHRARQALKRQLVRACGTCAAHGCLDCSCGKKKV